jgi:hypothetical protein
VALAEVKYIEVRQKDADSPDYPMTSAYSIEQNGSFSRAKLLLTVFTCLGVGEVAVGIVYVVLLSAFKTSIEADIYRLQWVWRLLLGIGLVPLAGTLYARLTMPESKPYKQCQYFTRLLPCLPSQMSQMTTRPRQEACTSNGPISATTSVSGGMQRH